LWFVQLYPFGFANPDQVALIPGPSVLFFQNTSRTVGTMRRKLIMSNQSSAL
jgi:hypothetical protein